MPKIKSLMQKISNSTFGQEIPLGADAENIDVKRLDEKGNIVTYSLAQIIDDLYNHSSSTELFWEDLPNT